MTRSLNELVNKTQEKNRNTVKLYADLLPQVSLAGYLHTDTGFVHPDRVMDVNVLLYVEKGYFHLYEENGEYTVGEGDLIFLKQGLHHYGDIKCPKGTKWFFVHFNLSDPENKKELGADEKYLYKEKESKGDIHCYRTLPKTMHLGKDSFIFAKFLTLEKMFSSEDIADNLRLNAYLYEILTDIYRENLLESRAGTTKEKVQNLKEFLKAKAESPFSSAEIEEHMKLSFKYLNMIFKKETGETLWNYHSRLRMEKAARLLAATSLPINEISARSGYDSPYYFSNAFKKFSGMSPSKYRKERLMI